MFTGRWLACFSLRIAFRGGMLVEVGVNIILWLRNRLSGSKECGGIWVCCCAGCNGNSALGASARSSRLKSRIISVKLWKSPDDPKVAKDAQLAIA